MNYMQKNLQFETVEDGYNQLIDAVKARDMMGGAMYWNILNEDACEIARAVLAKGGDRKHISSILGEGTFY